MRAQLSWHLPIEPVEILISPVEGEDIRTDALDEVLEVGAHNFKHVADCLDAQSQKAFAHILNTLLTWILG